MVSPLEAAGASGPPVADSTRTHARNGFREPASSQPYKQVAGMIGLPLLLLTAYLQWWWPLTIGSSSWFDLLPYLASLAAGLPFAVRFARRTAHKALWIVLYLLVGFWVMEFYAVFYLCAARNMCL